MPNSLQKPCANKAFPTFVFLHGLLGDKHDWQLVIEKLHQSIPHFSCLSLDLPLHGRNSFTVKNLAQSAKWLSQQIHKTLGSQPYILVAYSLGGRIALQFLCSALPKYNLRYVILEGANLGLKSEQEKRIRWQNDDKWAKRFEQEPLQQVLNDWYQQPVFAALNVMQRAELIAKRQNQLGTNIAYMLRATSLATQSDFSQKLAQSAVDFCYFFGEKDQKFCQMAIEHNLPHRIIAGAGHNAHWENPTGFVAALKEVIFSKI